MAGGEDLIVGGRNESESPPTLGSSSGKRRQVVSVVRWRGREVAEGERFGR